MSLLITVVLNATRGSHPDKNQLPYRIADDLKQLEDATGELDGTLTSSIDENDALPAYRQYIGQLKTMIDICQDADSYQAITSGDDPAADLTVMTSQLAKHCKSVTALSEFSLSHYRSAGPLFGAPAKLRRYQSWPLISSYTSRRISQAYAESLQALKGLPEQPGMDSSVTASYITTVAQAAGRTAAADGLATKASLLRNTQKQLLDSRVSYWRSIVGIADMHKAEQNQLASVCGYLSTHSDQPAACQRP